MARGHYETLQQVFDDAYRGLAVQGFEKSVFISGTDKPERCAYRGTQGAKCAIGHCIPDGNYDSKIEGYGARRLAESLRGLFSSNIDRWALRLLQAAHDGAESARHMQERLAGFAAQHGLTIPALSKAEGRSLSSASGQEGGEV